MMPGLRHNPRPRLLELLEGMAPAAAVPPLSVSGLTLDSRTATPGCLFLACRGTRSHGMEHAEEAVRRGASVIAAEPDDAWHAARLAGHARAFGIPVVAVADLGRRVSAIAARCYGEPGRGLRIAGVTGTNGKTSVSQYLAQALAADRRCAVLGTLGYGFPGALHPATHTTPDAVTVQRWLAELRAEGATAVAMEVSSHALHQHRVAAVPFHTAVFTNLSRDHLDYHGTMEAYAEAKSELFRHPGLALAVVNAEDALGRRLLEELRGRVATVACGLAPGTADAGDRYLRVADVTAEAGGLAFEFDSSWGQGGVHTPLLGRFNAENLALVLGVLLAWGDTPDAAAARLAQLVPVAGRMERFGGTGGQPLVVVDYAHTPDALGKVLGSLRAHVRGRLWCVFGCGGERDPGKRPLMGAAAEVGADRVVLTDDNPRREDGAQIVADILAGCARPERVAVERDRARAIRRAIAEAKPDDLVLVAGKGHEDYQLIGELRLPFSDAEQVVRALEELRA